MESPAFARFKIVRQVTTKEPALVFYESEDTARDPFRIAPLKGLSVSEIEQLVRDHRPETPKPNHMP